LKRGKSDIKSRTVYLGAKLAERTNINLKSLAEFKVKYSAWQANFLHNQISDVLSHEQNKEIFSQAYSPARGSASRGALGSAHVNHLLSKSNHSRVGTAKDMAYRRRAS
jgi:hypothetical protein